MKRISVPASFAPVLAALLISCVMTFCVSMVATARGIGFPPSFVRIWMQAWLMSWVVAFPTLFFVGPAVRRLVSRLCQAS